MTPNFTLQQAINAMSFQYQDQALLADCFGIAGFTTLSQSQFANATTANGVSQLPPGFGYEYLGNFYVVNAAGTGLNQILDSGGSWAANLPTTLPATAGVLWNNGGVLSIS